MNRRTFSYDSSIVVEVSGKHCLIKPRKEEDRPLTISFETLQDIKNRAFGKNATAIEIFPPETDPDEPECDHRHLWKIAATHVPDIKTGHLVVDDDIIVESDSAGDDI